MHPCVLVLLTVLSLPAGTQTPPGETTRDLVIRSDGSHAGGGVLRAVAALSRARIPEGAADVTRRVALVDGVLVYRDDPTARERSRERSPRRLVAIDAVTGRRLWRTRSSYTDPLIAGAGLVFARRDDSGYGTTAIALRSGHAMWGNRDLHAIGLDGGRLFASAGNVVVALEPQTGVRLWSSVSLGGPINDAPLLVAHGTVMVEDGEDGAIISNVLYAFDERTGTSLHREGAAMRTVLGVHDDLVYELTGWPGDLDAYLPATVQSFDPRISIGGNVQSYAPDPQRNGGGNNPWSRSGFVTARYVFFTVRDTLYRYDRDQPGATAHPTRMPAFAAAASYHGDDAWYTERGRVTVLSMRDPSFATRTVIDNVPPGVTLFRISGNAAYAAVPGRGVYLIDLDLQRAVALATASCKRFVDVTRDDTLDVTCAGASGPTLHRFRVSDPAARAGGQ